MKFNHGTGNSATLLWYALLMVAVVVAVDMLFFRHHFRGRLIANVAIVLLFLVSYLIFFRKK